MIAIPRSAEPMVKSFSEAFTRPTYPRMVFLAVGLILTFGRRTVAAVLWTLRGWAEGHSSTYHRVFSRAVWSLWVLGKALAWLIIASLPKEDPLVVAVDDTTAQHRGKKVYGKGCHHDAVRSSHTHVVWRWVIAGWCWQLWSSFPLPIGRGRCQFWLRCTNRKH